MPCHYTAWPPHCFGDLMVKVCGHDAATHLSTHHLSDRPSSATSLCLCSCMSGAGPLRPTSLFTARAQPQPQACPVWASRHRRGSRLQLWPPPLQPGRPSSRATSGAANSRGSSRRRAIKASLLPQQEGGSSTRGAPKASPLAPCLLPPCLLQPPHLATTQGTCLPQQGHHQVLQPQACTRAAARV